MKVYNIFPLARDIFKRFLIDLRLPKAVNYIRSIKNNDVVFIWIPKSAGVSIWSVLNKYYCPNFRNATAVKFYFCQKGFVTFGHQSYINLLEQGYISRSFDDGSFKFCFVRNPYDRFISLFFYFKRVGYIHDNLSLRSFAYILNDGAIEDIGLYNVKGLSQCNGQTRWIKDNNGNFFVDYVGKFENLHDDFEEVAKELNIHGQLDHKNETPHKHYREYYNDEIKKIVSKVYEEDLDTFGYTY